jgi:hypothetical protein
MDSVGDEKRIRALFSELSLEDQSSVPRFEELCERRLVGPGRVGGLSLSAVMIAAALLVVAGLSLGAWSWYRSNRASTSNAAELLPREISKPTLVTAQAVVEESKNRESAAPGTKSSAKHRRNVALRRSTDRTAIRDASLLSQWQSPTEIFLESPAAIGFNSLPQLNQSVDQLKQFLPRDAELKKESNR